MSISVPGPAVSLLVAVATAVVILAVAILPFLTPAWMAFAQERAGAGAWTGYGPEDLRTATNALLHDVVIGPPAFDVAVAGAPVLTEREQAHLRDVRGAFSGLAVVVAASLVVLVLAAVRGRSSAWLWRSVRAGALGLLGGAVLLGAAAAVAFDQAFEVFHQLFFAGGTYAFDPRTDRMVQLFPQQLWFETSLAVGVLLVALAIVVARWAGARAARLTGPPPAGVVPAGAAAGTGSAA